MAIRSFCRECDGTGWIPYRSETVDGGFEEAYRLCSNCYAPRYCMGSEANCFCPRPGTIRCGLNYYCKEHVEVVRTGGISETDHEKGYESEVFAEES